MISVIIPLYNKEQIIERSLRSVLSQDYDNFEVIVVNDGSTDRSAEIVKAIPDSRIVYVEQENGGPSKARNIGVRIAKGNWIVFLDADDEFQYGALKMFANVMGRNNECEFIDFSYYNYNGKDRILADGYKEGYVSNPFKAYFYKRINPRMGSFFCKRDVLLKCLFNEKIRRYEDDEMMFRLFNCVKMYYSPMPIMVCNQEYVSASNARRDIKEDFLGYIEFEGKSFWEKMCLYYFFLSERPYYEEQCRKMYSSLYMRYDLLLLSKILLKFHL